jgi:AraC-like DNA-binding protein
MPGVEAVTASTSHRFAKHSHATFGIGVIDRGAQKSLSGRGLVEAIAGDVITVNAGEVHDGSPIGDTGRAWRMLYLDPALIGEIGSDLSEGKRTGGEFQQPVIADAGLAARFRGLFASMTDQAETMPALRRDQLLLDLVAPIIAADNPSDQAHAIPAGIRHARSRIDDDPLSSMTLATLARDAGLSRFQFLRGFAKATGLTPHAYLVQRRIDLARRLIATGTSLAEAAIGSGFADQSHMTRVFVQKYGISPGNYAAALR